MSVYLVMGVNAYSMPSEATGELIEGITIQCSDEPAPSTSKRKGMQVVKLNGPIAAMADFTIVPGYYDINLTLKPGAGGKAGVKYESASFVKPLQLDFSKK